MASAFGKTQGSFSENGDDFKSSSAELHCLKIEPSIRNWTLGKANGCP